MNVHSKQFPWPTAPDLPRREVDPIVLQIVEGTLNSIEAEIEYATRAKAVTARYYGETEELLPKYAWYAKNSQEMTWPVGSLKPNDFGLFDSQVRGILPELGKHKNASNEKARRLLGWAPRTPKEAVLATARSLSELKLLKAG